MRNKIIIQGAGGVAGIGMTRCLQNDFDVYGTDDGEWASLVMEAKRPYEKNPLNFLNRFDLVIPIPDSLVLKSAPSKLAKKWFLPNKKQIECCQDKQKTAGILGELSPRVFWEREIRGAGGKGAKFVQEFLPGRNFSVELAYINGELISHFEKERISYLVKERETDVTKSGSSAVSRCIQDIKLRTLADVAIQRIADYTGTTPHGFYGVDFREDKDGAPKITEINAGRLLTASYTYFYSTGYNLPLYVIKRFLGDHSAKLGRYPDGVGVIRTTDKEPTIIKPEVANRWR